MSYTSAVHRPLHRVGDARADFLQNLVWGISEYRADMPSIDWTADDPQSSP